MKIYGTQELINEFGNVDVKMDPYVHIQLHFASQQFNIRLGEYNFFVIPYIISMKKMIFLSVLSNSEISFFQKFLNTLGTITLQLKEPGKANPKPLHIRAKIMNISGLKGRENLGLIQTVVPSCPEDLVQVLGQYLSAKKDLDKAYEEFKEEQVLITKEVNKKIGYNNIAEFYFNNEKISCRLTALGMHKIQCNVPKNLELLKENPQQKIKLYFRKYRVEANVEFKEGNKIGTNLTDCQLEIEKKYSLIEILEEYFFEERILEKKKNTDTKEV